MSINTPTITIEDYIIYTADIYRLCFRGLQTPELLFNNSEDDFTLTPYLGQFYFFSKPSPPALI
jgi:hypothetical protein